MHNFRISKIIPFIKNTDGSASIKDAYEVWFVPATGDVMVESHHTGGNLTPSKGYFRLTSHFYQSGINVREDRLQQACKDYVNSIKTLPIVTLPSSKPTEWIIGRVVDTTKPATFRTDPEIYTSEDVVDDKLNKLSVLNPAMVFLKLKIEARVTVPAAAPIWS